MLSESRQASTQYNDLLGTIAADGHDGTPLHDLARSFGVDTEHYFPLRIEVYNSWRGQVGVRFHVFDMSIAKNAGFDAFWTYAESVRTIPVRQLTVGGKDAGDILPHLKRLHIVLTNKSIDRQGLELYESGEAIDLTGDEE